MSDEATPAKVRLTDGLGPGGVPCADCRTPNSCTPDGACLEAYIGMRLGMLRDEAATLKVSLHHTECAAAAAEEDRDELLAHLSALVDRCAFDGVPNDSSPVWQAAHDAVMSRKRA